MTTRGMGLFRANVFFAIVAVAALLCGGCAAPVAPLAADRWWLDAEFDYRADRVTADAHDIFQLPPDLLQELRAPKLRNATADRRLQFLIDTVVANKTRPFMYVGGHTTGATQTWNTRQGDCLSLTVLTLAMAKELRLPAIVQEVTGSPVFDRRGNVDFQVGHVNVFINRHMATETPTSTDLTHGVVIDFEPSYGSTRMGIALSEVSVLARFYNNQGAEHLARSDYVQAYAYFKAALLAEPGLGSALNNLGWLYWHQGYAALAEAVLVQAVQHSRESDAAARALYRLLITQGRTQEAQQYEAQRIARQQQAPYYWIDQGREALMANHFDRAIDALERAQALTSGFSEVHRYLAAAYWHAGKPEKAQQQLATLSRIDREDPALPVLSRKFKTGSGQVPGTAQVELRLDL